MKAAKKATGLKSNPQLRQRSKKNIPRKQEELLNAIRVNMVRGSPSLEGAINGTSRSCPLCGAARGDAAHWLSECPMLELIRAVIDPDIDWTERIVSEYPEAALTLVEVALKLCKPNTQ